MVYKWRFTHPVPAEVAGKELERIEAENGCVSPQLVLDESRKESAPLHNVFEWNDSIAAEKYRLQQAGSIINNLLVVIEGHEDIEPVRAFVNVQAEAPAKKGEFINITSALQSKDSRDIVLRNAKAELAEFQRKYKDLTELAGVFSEISKLIA